MGLFQGVCSENLGFSLAHLHFNLGLELEFMGWGFGVGVSRFGFWDHRFESCTPLH